MDEDKNIEWKNEPNTREIPDGAPVYDSKGNNEGEVKNEEKKSTRICPYCKEPYKTKVGFSNWKNLFRKPTVDDWITLFILIMLIFGAFAYTTETKQCKQTLANIDKICLDYHNTMLNLSKTENSINILPPLIIPTENVSEIINDTNTSGQIIGGEKDEHGCVIPAGYSWCESLQKCIRPWETNCSNEVTGSPVKVNVATMSNSTNASINS